MVYIKMKFAPLGSHLKSTQKIAWVRAQQSYEAVKKLPIHSQWASGLTTAVLDSQFMGNLHGCPPV